MTETDAASPLSQDEELIAFVKNRSAPCPRCNYDLRDIQKAQCPECGEPLVLKIGSPRPQFGWFVLAMAPGCFSGVAAVFLLVPITLTIVSNSLKGLPWPIVCVDIFGFCSAATVWFMYRARHSFLKQSTRRQAWYAFAVWSAHAAALGLFILAMAFWR